MSQDQPETDSIVLPPVWAGPRWVALQQDPGDPEYTWWALADMHHTGVRAKVLGQTLADQIVDGLNAAEEG